MCVKERERVMGEEDAVLLHLEELFVGGFSSFWIISACHCQNQASEVSPILTFKQTFGGEREKKMKRETKSPSPLSLLLLAGSQSLFCWNGGATWNRSVLVHFFFFYMSGSLHRHSKREILWEIKSLYILFCSDSIIWFCNQNIK